MTRPLLAVITALSALALASPVGAAVVRRVPQDYARVTDALAACGAGDTVRVAAGTWSAASNGEVFPLAVIQPGLVLEGAGAGLSILDAAQAGTVVRCAAAGVRVTGFTITGGRAQLGGGVHLESGDAQIDHNAIVDCAAVAKGASIHAAVGTTPWVHHNVMWGSVDALPSAGGDPHGMQLTGCNGVVEFNTIGRGDSNGLIVEQAGEPIIRNNIFFENGSATLNRGRGICALGGPGTVIRNNVFYGNYIAAILVFFNSYQDLPAEEADAVSPNDGILENRDANPALADANARDVHLTAGSPAIDAGWIGSPVDPDGTRADAGAFFYDQAVVSAGGGPPAGTLRLSAAPNPFRGRTLLSYTLARGARVRLSIVNARGQLVRTLAQGDQAAGRHEVVWYGLGKDEGAKAGVYFGRLEVDGLATSQTLVLVP